MHPEQKAESIPRQVGPYAILRSLGRGGMGEVYLAKDPICGRLVALKQIRPELQKNSTIRSRFLREAKVASLLTHPSIVPILAIEPNGTNIYYTMPYVEGDTLRQILREAREQEKNPTSPPPIGRSIPALTRIFLQVCEAVAYTHSKKILHRDLKPENIIVGKFGEVMILDWGIADFIGEAEEEERFEGEENLTRPGKIAGTLAYMAPERLKGFSSSIQTDLYALGVILYQILTLQLPFHRKTLAAFRKQVDSESLIDPTEMAPYRDIPHPLAAICNKCLAHSVSKRYTSVEALSFDVKGYVEGRPEWILLGELDLKKKSDWHFQEHVLLAKHIAITQTLEMTEWATLMVSERQFADNLRLEAELQIKEPGQGFGFLLSVPEASVQRSLEEGYCLWVGLKVIRLFRNNVLVLEAQAGPLKAKTWHKIRIEKIEDHLRFFVDDELRLSYVSCLPMAGTYIGCIHKDSAFSLRALEIYDASRNALVGCLAVPNAFFSHKLYDLALQEYRRIGQCFAGRFEGREALFRAGLTLLEKGKAEKEKGAREKLFSQSLKEFETLYRTNGAPLEYLGKSLVYEALGDSEEEAKCLELSLRKFPKHPILSRVKEHIVYRIHESSLKDRETAYRLLLLAIRHIPDLLDNPDTQALVESLERHWEPLPFVEEGDNLKGQIAIQLAFWLAKVPILLEIADSLAEAPDDLLLGNALFCLIELEAADEAKKRVPRTSSPRMDALKLTFSQTSRPYPPILDKPSARSIHYWLRKGLKNSQFQELERVFQKLKRCKMSKEDRLAFDGLEAWSCLLQNKLPDAAALFKQAPPSTLQKESSPLHFVYGAYLYLSEGKKAAMNHFNSLLDVAYPTTPALPSYFLTGRINDKAGWIERAFWWEKKELHRQIELFYRCVGKT
jgi:serine/threonine protein kinase/tetratricopeptide (TPR) repeat protein